MIANGKRYAYDRIQSRELIFSESEEEAGVHSGKIQTVFLRVSLRVMRVIQIKTFKTPQLPGKQSIGPSSWSIQAKLSIFMWIGATIEKEHFFGGLPHGYDISHELRNAERPRTMAPSNVHYLEKHVS